MTPRSIRRALERKAKKQELRAARQTTPQQSGARSDPESAFVPTGETVRAQANRLNAQSSTGPRTPEGKAASSKNSFQHGLYSKQLFISGEDPAAFERLKAELQKEHQPQGPTEECLVTFMAEHMWRLRRARRLESAIWNIDEEPSPAHLVAIQRLTSASERGFYKAFKTLRELHKQRGFVPQSQRTTQGTKTLRPSVPAKAEPTYTSRACETVGAVTAATRVDMAFGTVSAG